jgi:hypothetical protein
MIAFPAHGNLDRIVEICNSAVAADENPPPDERTDFPQPDMELVDFGMECRWAHALECSRNHSPVRLSHMPSIQAADGCVRFRRDWINDSTRCFRVW